LLKERTASGKQSEENAED